MRTTVEKKGLAPIAQTTIPYPSTVNPTAVICPEKPTPGCQPQRSSNPAITQEIRGIPPAASGISKSIPADNIGLAAGSFNQQIWVIRQNCNHCGSIKTDDYRLKQPAPPSIPSPDGQHQNHSCKPFIQQALHRPDNYSPAGDIYIGVHTFRHLLTSGLFS